MNPVSSHQPHNQEIDILMYLCEKSLLGSTLNREIGQVSSNPQIETKVKEEKNKDKSKEKITKSTGRWKYKEHCIYLEVVRLNLSQKQLIHKLNEMLPGRKISQIRAHHQKMMFKFEGAERMLNAYSSPEMIKELMEMCNILDKTEEKLSNVKPDIKEVLEERDWKGVKVKKNS